jgi:diguanylate cyclase (GGDEF)-like protein/PAS domain S-box-containing protein
MISRVSVLEGLVANAPAGLGFWDRDLRCVLVNDAFADATGMPASEHVGRRLADLLPQLAPVTLSVLRSRLASGEPMPDVEIAGPGDPNARSNWLASFFAVRAPDGEVVGLAAVLSEITDRKRLEASLEHRASHDPLTGLPNRRLFADRVEEATSRTRRRHGVAAVLFTDLDAFKQVNDELGHDAGDRLLTAIAGRLRGAIRPGDTIARLGGDEFGVLCEDLRDQRDGVAVAERVIEAVALPVELAEREVRVRASVGIAFATEHGVDGDALLRQADAAMYRAKQQGGHRWEIFDRAMRSQLRRRFAFAQALRSAVDRGELRLWFQPQFSVIRDAPVGVEALVRWQHPERGLLAPGAFISEAEATGAIHGLGAWVLDEACRVAERLTDGEGRPLRISVNLSPAQLERTDLVDAVAGTLERYSLAPGRLGLEITETLFMQDTRANMITVAALRALGVRIILDDFGAGYSSLAYLRRLPLDEIKLDRTFVGRLPVNGSADGAVDERIASFVIDLARTLGLEAVAEGVETNHQIDCLRALGYDLVQGYLVGRPLALADLERALAA